MKKRLVMFSIILQLGSIVVSANDHGYERLGEKPHHDMKNPMNYQMVLLPAKDSFAPIIEQHKKVEEGMIAVQYKFHTGTKESCSGKLGVDLKDRVEIRMGRISEIRRGKYLKYTKKAEIEDCFNFEIFFENCTSSRTRLNEDEANVVYNIINKKYGGHFKVHNAMLKIGGSTQNRGSALFSMGFQFDKNSRAGLYRREDENSCSRKFQNGIDLNSIDLIFATSEPGQKPVPNFDKAPIPSWLRK